MVIDSESRRQYLKYAGAAGIAGLAGCMGGGSTGGSNSENDLTAVDFVYPPWAGYPAFHHITKQTNILENKLNKRGYTTGKITESWDDTTLFMSGKADIMPTAGGAESAQMAMKRDLELTVHAQAATNYEGWYVRKGSDLDPANTGSAQATMKKVMEENRPYGHPGMNQGVVWPESAMWYNRFGIKFGPGTNPPLNIKQTDWFSLPQLLLDGKVDMIVNAPALGMTSTLVKDDPRVVDIRWCQPEVERAGLSPRTLNLGGFATRTKFSENHEGAIVGWMEAWKEGVKWSNNRDNWDDILGKKENWKYFSAQTKQQAKYNLHFAYSDNPSQEKMLSTENSLPIILEDFELNDQRIADYKKAIKYMEKTGALKSDRWEDLLSFKAISVS